MKNNKYLSYIVALGILTFGSVSEASVRSLYGKVSLDPLTKKLASAPLVKRMKHIDWAGPSRYFRSFPSYSLFDHAFGVYILLQRYNRPLNEKIAGLLEPVGHTAFANHVGITTKNNTNNVQKSYHHIIQKKLLIESKIDKLLNLHRISLPAIDPSKSDFVALHKSPPLVSVFALEKILRLAFTYQLLTQKEISKLLDDLSFTSKGWVIKNIKSAQKLANLSLYFADKYWASPTNYVIDRWFGKILKRALNLKIIQVNDLLYGIDKQVLRKILAAQDKIIKRLVRQCRSPYRYYKVDDKQYDEIYYPVMHAINPLVQTNGKIIRLSDVDRKFNSKFVALQSKFRKGIKIYYRKPKQARHNAEFIGGSLSSVNSY